MKQKNLQALAWASGLRPGLERNPVVARLLSRGGQVTREAYSTTAFGTSEEKDLDPEQIGQLNWMFPEEE